MTFNFYFNPPKYMFKNSNDEEVSVFTVPIKTPKAVDDQIPKASILADFPFQEDGEGEFSSDALLVLANQAFNAFRVKDIFKTRWGSAKTSINGYFILEAQPDLSELPDECRSAGTEEEKFIIFSAEDSCTDIDSLEIRRTFYFHNGTTINLAVCSVAAKNMLDAKKPSFSNMGSALLKTSMFVSAKQSLFNILNQKNDLAGLSLCLMSSSTCAPRPSSSRTSLKSRNWTRRSIWPAALSRSSTTCLPPTAPSSGPRKRTHSQEGRWRWRWPWPGRSHYSSGLRRLDPPLVPQQEKTLVDQQGRHEPALLDRPDRAAAVDAPHTSLKNQNFRAARRRTPLPPHFLPKHDLRPFSYCAPRTHQWILFF